MLSKKVQPELGTDPVDAGAQPGMADVRAGRWPHEPLGTRALYLSWQCYRRHGSHDTRKIGRRSSNGCIGLFNEHIEEVFDRTPVGTQVKLI